MGEAYIAFEPKCPTHGQMSPVRHLFRGVIGQTGWTCWGWDGEGCGYSVADDELDWQPVDAVHIEFPPGKPLLLRGKGTMDWLE